MAKKRTYQKSRNWVAVAAFNATGGGKHGDRRTKRRKTRRAKNKAAIAEFF